MVHGLAGLAHASINTWPMLLIAGSAEQVRRCLMPFKWSRSGLSGLACKALLHPSTQVFLLASFSHAFPQSFLLLRASVGAPAERG